MSLDLHAAFEAANDEYIRFERIENPRCKRPDLHAFLLLNELVPGEGDIISASEHDEFYLDVDCDELAKVATQDHIIELSRCGVRYSREYDCLCMFA